MVLVRAMGSALSGLTAQQFQLDTIGNNLANATTTGYKSARLGFQTTLSQTIRFGSAPQGSLGGVDPFQIGLGVSIGSTTRNFGQGELQATGLASDLAIDGSGFFITRDSHDRQVFTRDGAFSVNPDGFLHDPSTGFMVQGVNADYANFSIPQGGPLEDVVIPVGSLQIAVATTTAVFDGNLNTGGDVSHMGTTLQSVQFQDNVGATPAVAGTLLTDLSRANGVGFLDLNISAGDTLAVNATKGGRPLPEQRFFVGASLPVGYDGFGTTLGDFQAFLQRALGINTDNGLQYGAIRDNDTNPNTQGVSFSGPLTAFAPSTTAPWTMNQVGTDFTAEGVRVGDLVRFNSGAGAGQIGQVTAVSTTTTANDTLTVTALAGTLPLPVSGDQYTIHEPAGVSIADSAVTPWLTDGALYVAGNAGSANAITDLSIMNVTNNISFTPFTQIDAASGESVVTNALVYDSIGNAHQVEVTYVLEAKGVVDPISGSVGNVWRVYTEAADSKQLSGAGVLLGTQRATGSGQLLFSTEGQFLSQTGTPGVGFVTINLPNQGAITPLTFTPDFSDVTGFGNTQSIVFMRSQDGLPTGILTDFQVDQDGVVKGIFTNGATRDLAQIMVARFPNPNGLEEDGANNFRVATNSGTPVISAPGQQSAGLIVGGALEASNVDFAKEFSDLIVAQRAFQANARVITRSDQMLETLVNIV